MLFCMTPKQTQSEVEQHIRFRAMLFCMTPKQSYIIVMSH